MTGLRPRWELVITAPLLLLQRRVRLDPAKHLLDGAPNDGGTTRAADVQHQMRRHGDGSRYGFGGIPAGLVVVLLPVNPPRRCSGVVAAISPATPQPGQPGA